MESEFVKVAVDAPIDGFLSYKIPQGTTPEFGRRVTASLGSRKAKGVLVDWESHTPEGVTIKEYEAPLNEPVLGEKTREWLSWLSRYYYHPPGMVYSMAFVDAPNQKGKSRKSNPIPNEKAATKTIIPNTEQQDAIQTIVKAIEGKVFRPFLLHGITGSGKTEVYLRTIEKVVANGQQALVLVPEISLTPQLLKRFAERFGDQIAVIHSHLTPREKSVQWWNALKGEKKILIGARSALFCPIENLGVIIVDEEHDSSFKQDEGLKYSARDAAIKKAQLLSCPVVLGSATPSLESWYNALQKKYTLLSLSARVEGRPLPIVNVIDMRSEKHRNNNILPYWMSEELYKNLVRTLDLKEQSAIFLNRRGFAQYLFCDGCGKSVDCPSCSVSLTAHRYGNSLLCHYCGFTKETPSSCPSCSTPLRQFGLGTERIVEDIRTLFPSAKILRADRDEIDSRERLESLLEQLNSGTADIVVGTQMIAKGHDFPNLTLVGIVNADVGVHIPDFRASERTFQLLTQVSGRAGRHQKKGIVILQTYIPESFVVRCATNQDFIKFAGLELEQRKAHGFPPYGRLATVRIQGPTENGVKVASENLARHLKKIAQNGVEILGPCQCPLVKLKNKFRYQILVRGTDLRPIQALLKKINSSSKDIPSTIKIQVDVDPLQNL